MTRRSKATDPLLLFYIADLLLLFLLVASIILVLAIGIALALG